MPCDQPRLAAQLCSDVIIDVAGILPQRDYEKRSWCRCCVLVWLSWTVHTRWSTLYHCELQKVCSRSEVLSRRLLH